MIKIVGLCASPKNGATEYTVKRGLEEIQARFPEAETEFITLRGKKIEPCIDCRACIRKKSWCVLEDDMKELADIILEADGLLVASPVYVMGATPQLHAFCSRMRAIHHCFPGMMQDKFVSAIAVGGSRNGGQEMTVNEILNLFGARAMNIVTNAPGGYLGGKVWSDDKGAEGAAADEIGMDTVLPLAVKLADVCLTYAYGKRARER